MKGHKRRRRAHQVIQVNVAVTVNMPPVSETERPDRYALAKKVGKVGVWLFGILFPLLPMPNLMPDRPGAPQEAARPTAQFATANIVNFATATTANAASPTTNNATTTTTNSAVLPCSQLGFAHSPYMCLNAPGKDLTPRP